jgi:hypothetical protein
MKDWFYAIKILRMCRIGFMLYNSCTCAGFL